MSFADFLDVSLPFDTLPLRRAAAMLLRYAAAIRYITTAMLCRQLFRCLRLLVFAFSFSSSFSPFRYDAAIAA